jgi:hypothetical protein
MEEGPCKRRGGNKLVRSVPIRSCTGVASVASNTRRRPSRPPVPCTTTLRSRTVPHGGPESSRPGPGRLCVGVKLTASTIIFFHTPETILVSASGLGLYDKLAQLVCVYAMHRGSAFIE